MNGPENRSHQPKGGMCSEDCSGLPFETMPVIVEAPSGVKIVRCTEQVRSNAGVTGLAPEKGNK